MSASPSQIRAYRILGVCAVFHSSSLLLLPLAMGDASGDWERCWVGLATLWFFWPIMLAFHAGAVMRRAIVFLMASALPIFFWFRFYSLSLGPYVFDLPEGMDLTPPGVLAYASFYGLGWIDGKRDMQAGRLTFEGYGMSGRMTPDNPQFSDEARKRFGLEIEPVALCAVNTRIMAHAKGHNDAALGEIIRRFGRAAVSAAEEEEKRNQEQYSAAMEVGKKDAERDVQAGHLALEVFRPSREETAVAQEILKERFQIELRRIGQDWQLADEISRGHATGYNQIVKVEVERRFGREALSLVNDAEDIASRFD